MLRWRRSRKMGVGGLVLLAGLVLAPGPAAAGEEGLPVLSLKESIKVALEKSAAVRAAAENVTGAEWKKKQALTQFLPTFSARYSFTRLDEEPAAQIMGREFATGTRDNWQLTGAISQPLFTGFSLLSNYELAKLGLDVAQISLDREELDLILQVKEAYFGILQAEKGLEVADQSVKQLEAHLKVARSFYEVGMVPKNHVLEAEVRLAQAVQDRVLARNNVRLAQARLNLLLGRPLEAELKVEDILAHQPARKDLEVCVKQGLKLRPEAKAARKQIEMGQQKVRLARSAYFPSVSLKYNMYKRGDTWAVEGTDFQDANAWDVTAVASWNFWEWGRTRDEIQASRAELAGAREKLNLVEDAVRLEVTETYLSLEATEKNIFVARKAVEQAEENYRMSVERYREQVATSTEVMDAETLLTTARNNHYRALYQFNLARARLERAIGLRPGGV